MIQPKCFASASPIEKPVEGTVSEAEVPPNCEDYFKNAQWSADGTSLIAVSTDHAIHTYIVPPDLLEDRQQPLSLRPYCSVKCPEPVNVIVGYPHFNLQDPSTTLMLSSTREHPIRLHSALTGHLGASYPLVNPMTEAYINPASMVFTPDGRRFVAGSESLISTFDLSRPGEEPLMSFPTGPKKKHRDFNAVSNMRGIVSALAIDPGSGLLASGTYTRHVGLYESLGQGECVGVFSIEGTEAEKQIRGGGITQLHWSPSGRYLYISERKSSGVMVYDIRQTGQLLCWLEGRNAYTNQRLGVDLVVGDAQYEHEIWAGGLDGKVRMWKNPYELEGAVAPAFEYAFCDDAVSSAVSHPNGGVIATTSGQRHFDSEDGLNSRSAAHKEPPLKIWSL